MENIFLNILRKSFFFFFTTLKMYFKDVYTEFEKVFTPFFGELTSATLSYFLS